MKPLPLKALCNPARREEINTSWCFGGQQGDKVQEGDLHHQGMETGGKQRELRGAGTTYPDFQQLDVALQCPFLSALCFHCQQDRRNPPVTPASSVGRAET